ncbi:MAG: TlpA disulfide reductase family protein [Vicinamibacteria bacterium]
MTRRSLFRLRPLAFAGVLAGVCFPSTSVADDAQGGPPPVILKAGETVLPFEATGVDGTIREIKYSSTTVIVFFLSGCPTCHKMLPEWNWAYERKGKDVQMVGVLMDREPPGFFDVNPVAFPVVRAPSREFGRIFKVARVPITLRVAAGGKVESAELGLLDRIKLGALVR